jgi:hypothetical protein
VCGPLPKFSCRHLQSLPDRTKTNAWTPSRPSWRTPRHHCFLPFRVHSEVPHVHGVVIDFSLAGDCRLLVLLAGRDCWPPGLRHWAWLTRNRTPRYRRFYILRFSNGVACAANRVPSAAGIPHGRVLALRSSVGRNTRLLGGNRSRFLIVFA